MEVQAPDNDDKAMPSNTNDEQKALEKIDFF